jgi:hypothetical protein
LRYSYTKYKVFKYENKEQTRLERKRFLYTTTPESRHRAEWPPGSWDVFSGGAWLFWIVYDDFFSF